jgi:hypothetical protein
VFQPAADRSIRNAAAHFWPFLAQSSETLLPKTRLAHRTRSILENITVKAATQQPVTYPHES